MTLNPMKINTAQEGAQGRQSMTILWRKLVKEGLSDKVSFKSSKASKKGGHVDITEKGHRKQAQVLRTPKH